MLAFSVNNAKGVTSAMGAIKFMPATDKGREWLSTMFFRAITGDVTVDTNPDAYGFGCDRNDTLTKVKKEVNMVTIDSFVDTYGGVAIPDTVASYVDDNIDEIMDRSEFKDQVRQFVDMREYLITESGVDLWVLMRKAYEANERAVARFRDIVAEFHLGDLVKVILNNDGCMKTLQEVLD